MKKILVCFTFTFIICFSLVLSSCNNTSNNENCGLGNIESCE